MDFNQLPGKLLPVTEFIVKWTTNGIQRNPFESRQELSPIRDIYTYLL